MVNVPVSFFYQAFAIVIGSLSLCLWLQWRHKRGSLCPYSGKRMLLCEDIAVSLFSQVNVFLRKQQPEWNSEIDPAQASYCPVTGRIFPHTVALGRVMIPRHFLRRRYAGAFVSWGSLSEKERGEILLMHEDLNGFQTEYSSPHADPAQCSQDYAMRSPGPLYVDRASHVIIGWKKVPGTSFEVLVVQVPRFLSVEESL